MSRGARYCVEIQEQWAKKKNDLVTHYWMSSRDPVVGSIEYSDVTVSRGRQSGTVMAQLGWFDLIKYDQKKRRLYRIGQQRKRDFSKHNQLWIKSTQSHPSGTANRVHKICKGYQPSWGSIQTKMGPFLKIFP